MLANYSPLANRLAHLVQRGQLYGFLAEHQRPFPAQWGEVSLAKALLSALEYLLPTNGGDDILDWLLGEFETTGREFELDDLPLSEIVELSGLDESQSWEDWPELWQFAICLLFAGSGYGDYDKDTAAWWRDHAVELNLPPLGKLDWEQLGENLADLPAPWAGLAAMLDWLCADTGNIFVDIPADQSIEYLGVYGFEWTAENLNTLVRSCQEAELKIFEPVADLLEEYHRQPGLTLRRCADLALDRHCLVQDGEIIWLNEPENITQPKPINTSEGELIYA